MASLDEIRAKLKALDNTSNSNNSNEDGNLVFPHWNMSEGETTILRFLPDADPNNTFFWRERLQINLSFAGVKGQDETKSVTVKVPCMEMWNQPCPVLTEIRPWFKDPALEDTARKYWKKRSYFMQGFVVETGVREDNVPENPIRKFIITPQIFNIIKSALLDPDMEYVPTDYDNGVNFVIAKTSKGGYNDYSTSKYARRETPLTDEQKAAVNTHGLFNLNDWMPAQPTAEAVQAISEMFEASVNGELYDVERWGQFYRPYGVQAASGSAAPAAPKPAAAPKPVAQPVAEAEPVAAAESEVTQAQAVESSAASAKDILAKIRARNAD